jgi:hypothetical protein
MAFKRHLMGPVTANWRTRIVSATVAWRFGLLAGTLSQRLNGAGRLVAPLRWPINIFGRPPIRYRLLQTANAMAVEGLSQALQ